MSQPTSEFVQFLIGAKRATYAAGAAPAGSSRPHSKDLSHRAGDYLYIDTYLGAVDFAGEEAVWHCGRPLWGMNYYGRMLVAAIPPDFSRCLKEALQQVPEAAPFRGPQYHACGELEYHCRWEGELGFFSGRETICQNGAPIYELLFHGGWIHGGD
ncbi:MAG TPA: DUF5680 domain-containing protein [Anaerolineaceae bacterium]|nr:DUF5680 domain-containing protein [Anaerolineaceae bacterium]